MIGTLAKFSGASRASALVAYMTTAKAVGKNPQERVGHTSSHLIPVGITPGQEDRDACRNFANEVAGSMKRWNREARPNKVAPKTEFYHLTLSFHPDDPVTPMSCGAIAEEVIEEVVGKDRPRYLAVHVDRDHLHAHALISTVDSQGKIFNPRFDYRLIEAACESAELRHGLTRVRQRRAMAGKDPSRAVEIAAVSTRELRRTLRTGVPAPRELLKQQLSAALHGSPSFTQFADRLNAQGVKVMPHVATTGRVSGLSFVGPDGMPRKGSSLGRAFTFGAICKTTKYEPHRDQQIINEWCAIAKNGRADPADRSIKARTGRDLRNHHCDPNTSDRDPDSALQASRGTRRSAADYNQPDQRAANGIPYIERHMAGVGASTAGRSGRTAKADPGIGETVTAINETAGQWASMNESTMPVAFKLLSLLAQLVGVACAQSDLATRQAYRRPTVHKRFDSQCI
jgi:hypothetical protein